MNAKQRRVARREHMRQLHVIAKMSPAFSESAEAVMRGMAAMAASFQQMADAMVTAVRAWEASTVRRMLAEHAIALRTEDASPQTIATLLDLARAGHEADFRWLAASAGVRAEELGALWTGTRSRVTPPPLARDAEERTTLDSAPPHR